MPRLVIAFGVFVAVVGVADFHGFGTGYARILLAYLWFFVAMRLSPPAWRLLWAAALWLSVAVAVVALAQLAVMPRPFGMFRSANFLGGFAALMAMLSLQFGGRLRRLQAAANVLAVIVSQSRGAWLALACAGALLGWRRWPRATAAVCGLTLYAIGYLTLLRGVDDPRFGIWRIALAAGARRPWLGWGENGLALSYTGLASFYNVALEWFIAAGLVGVAAGVWLCWEALRASAGHIYAQAALLAFAVQGMFLSGSAVTYLPMVTLLAWLASEQRGEEHRACVVDDGQPLLNGGVAADRAD